MANQPGNSAYFVRLDHVADCGCIDVGTGAAGEGLGGLFIDDPWRGRSCPSVDRVFFVEREVFRVAMTVGEDDAIGRLAGGDDDLGNTEFHGGLDNVVGAHHVDAIDLVIRRDHDPRNGREMHHRIDLLRPQIGVEFMQAGIARQRIEHLAGIGDVGDQCADCGIVERLGIEIENPIAAIDEILHDMAPGLAAATGEDHTLLAHSF